MILDAQQQPVVDHEGGHLLVVAGAGSGKTRAITERTARRLRGGQPAGRTIMTTFTNKAAREMRERLAGLLGVDPADPRLPFIGTQHGFGMRIIRRYRESLGLSRYSLIDGDDAVREQKALLIQGGVDKDDRELLDRYLRMMDKLTNEGVFPCAPPWRTATAPWTPAITGIPLPGAKDLDMDLVHRVRASYAQEKFRSGILDIDDLILLPLWLITDQSDIRATLAGYLREIVVDEAQDLNGAQYQFWQLLAQAPGGGPRLVLVGDDDQAIYRWRDAHPRFLMAFSRHPETTILRMEANYRSHATIVTQAAALIKHNIARLTKEPFPVESRAGIVRALAYQDGGEIGARIARAIQEARTARPSTSVAILYRTHRLKDLVEDALLEARIPYEIKDGTALLDRAEPRMILAIARLAANPNDMAALRRVSEALDGVGDKALDILAKNPNGPLSPEAIADLPKKPKAALQDFMERLSDLRANGPRTMAQWVASYPALGACFTKNVTRQVKQRESQKSWSRITPGTRHSDAEIRAMQSLATAKHEAYARIERAIALLCQCADEEPEAVGAERWEAALAVMHGIPEAGEKDGKSPSGAPPVLVGTIHGAKGLEWDHVHIIGWSDGLLPLSRAEDQEEERSLAYVALTRAREEATLYHATHYPIPGMSHLDYQPSPFSSEANVVFERVKTVATGTARPSFGGARTAGGFS